MGEHHAPDVDRWAFPFGFGSVCDLLPVVVSHAENALRHLTSGRASDLRLVIFVFHDVAILCLYRKLSNEIVFVSTIRTGDDTICVSGLAT